MVCDLMSFIWTVSRMNLARTQRRPIRLLDPECVERIAAGEVVERPASVVKELVENSLDAGATRILVRLKRSGLEELVVEDDGAGIPGRELPLAVERHATSKIAGSGDLMAIYSYGFRGEALAAIASVSRMTVRSRSANEDIGARIDIAGGRIEKREPDGRHRGTTIVVRDLFFNTPARKAFLRSEQSERRAVAQVITSMALAHPAVAFTLRNDDSVVIDLSAADDLETRAHAVFGAAVATHLRRFEGETEGLRVEGLVSLPTYTRGNRTGQHFLVNRRVIHDKGMSGAVYAAFRDVLPAGRFALALVFLEVGPARVDVNVHPTKAEVRFRDEGMVHELIRHSIRDALTLGRERGEVAPAPPRRGASSSEGQGEPHVTEADLLSGPTEGYDRGPAWSRRKESPTLFDDGQVAEGGTFRPQGAPVDPGMDPGMAIPTAAAGLPLFWQLHNTFILTQIRGALVIVDQHNSHERILYNEGQKALAGQAVASQQLLFPATLELNAAELATYEVHQGDLEKMAFRTEPFGGNTVLVRGIPPELRNWNDGALLRDILADLGDAGRSGSDPREAILASYACHGAIRAGEKLTLPEMQSLMDRLFATEVPYSCPHGRPTLIRLGLSELERRFGRR